MKKNLLIVESPNKVNKLQSFLPNDWIVTSSRGHIKDLATWGTKLRLGLDLDNMIPSYIDIKANKDRIQEIKELSKKIDNIFLATDPDREGETIAYHIKSIIENKNANFKRITFNEITKKTVLDAIENFRDLDLDLIHSQESRRILDRIIGFRLSYLTNKKISARSAGRVKSAILKLIIDRENEIENFKIDYWWTIEAKEDNDHIFINVSKKNYSELKYKKNEDAIKILNELTGNLEFVEEKKSLITIKSPSPLEMATYLMAMYSVYSTPNSSATIAAQSLYEKGLITYPRTDSKRISSSEFITESKEYIIKNYGKEYYKGLQKISTKENVQDAHEAIRPVNINKTPSSLRDLKINEKRAYSLIWTTTIKSLMKNGKNQNIKSIYKDNIHYFSLNNSIIVDEGFRIVDEIQKETKEKTNKKILKIKREKFKSIEHKTKPPARYNQSSLIKLMKNSGIGRPSTYSGVTSGLLAYGYVVNFNNTLKPTEMAIEVNELLQTYFGDIINEKYTAEMEKILDIIALGEKDWQEYLKSFWKNFEPRINKVDEEVPKKPPIYIGRDCPECLESENPGKLIIKRGKFGEFISCDNFPICKYTEPLVPKIQPKKVENEKCPICSNDLVIREAKRTKRKFIGCSSYPECSYIKPEDQSIEILFNLNEISIEEKTKRLLNFNKKNKPT